jgi:hypothetical protein
VGQQDDQLANVPASQQGDESASHRSKKPASQQTREVEKQRLHASGSQKSRQFTV